MVSPAQIASVELSGSAIEADSAEIAKPPFSSNETLP